MGLIGSIVVTKTLRLQIEHMGTHRTIVTLYGVPMGINEDYVGAFSTWYGQVEEVARILSKAGVPFADFAVQVIPNRTKFNEIPNILICRDKDFCRSSEMKAALLVV